MKKQNLKDRIKQIAKETVERMKRLQMGLSECEAEAIWEMADDDAKWLASDYCMSILEKPESHGFNDTCLMTFRSPKNVAVGNPLEKYFELRCGDGKFFNLKTVDYDFKNKKQFAQAKKFYMHHLFRRMMHWIKEYRTYGVFNWAHYETYHLIAKFGFPVMANVKNSN